MSKRIVRREVADCGGQGGIDHRKCHALHLLFWVAVCDRPQVPMKLSELAVYFIEVQGQVLRWHSLTSTPFGNRVDKMLTTADFSFRDVRSERANKELKWGVGGGTSPLPDWRIQPWADATEGRSRSAEGRP